MNFARPIGCGRCAGCRECRGIEFVACTMIRDVAETCFVMVAIPFMAIVAVLWTAVARATSITRRRNPAS